MTKKQFEKCKKWFDEYVAMYTSDDPRIRDGYAMKTEHTLRVCEEIKVLGLDCQLDRGDTHVATTAALFHDIGRYDQFREYGTFSDVKSEDHADLGVRVLLVHEVLDNLHPEDREFILDAIHFHNKLEVDRDLSDRSWFFAHLLRDADKLDIFRVVLDEYQSAKPVNGSIFWDLPDEPKISDRVMHQIKCKQLVNRGDAKTLSDFKVLQLSWIYDLYFPNTGNILKERGYVEALLHTFPDIPGLSDLSQTLLADLDAFSKQRYPRGK